METMKALQRVNNYHLLQKTLLTILVEDFLFGSHIQTK